MENKEHRIGDLNLYTKEHIPQERAFPHPLVFVHGSFGGAWMWNMIVPRLVEQGFSCYTLSLRGHRPNDEKQLEGATMDDYVADVHSVVSKLNLQDPVVIGHSMGGLVALMYAKDQSVTAVVLIDPSPSLEIQGRKNEKDVAKIPPVYTAIDAGMPTEPEKATEALPDLPAEMLIKMKDMLGPESGEARKQRKLGISVPKESILIPTLFMAAELGDSVPFGISAESTKKLADYYGSKIIKIAGATHPGIVMGSHSSEVAEKIALWLKKTLGA